MGRHIFVIHIYVIAYICIWQINIDWLIAWPLADPPNMHPSVNMCMVWSRPWHECRGFDNAPNLACDYYIHCNCSDLRSVTMHLQNYGPTSETLKHGHMRCNDFWIESCFRVHSSKISKQMFISDTMVHMHQTWYNNGTIVHYYYPIRSLGYLLPKSPKQSYSVQRFLADCRCIHFVTNQFMQLQQLNTHLILILNFAIVYLHFVF